MSTLSLAQQKAVAIVPKISSSLSILGSGWIICETLNNRSKLKKVLNRIIFMMSISDVILSSSFLLSTWPMPRGTEGVWGAAGSSRTCTAQGFFMLLGISSAFYSAGLASYYVLIVRYHVRDAVLQRYFEPYVHLFSILLPLGTSIASVFMDLFRPRMTWCRLETTHPSYCDGEDPTCSRQRRAQLFGLLFSIVPMSLCVLLVSVSMVVVYLTVRKIENRTVKYHSQSISIPHCDTSNRDNNDLAQTSHSTENNDISLRSTSSRSSRRMRQQQRKSRQVAYQAMYYIGAAILTAIFPVLSASIFASRADDFVMLLPKTIFFPLLGFFNVIIYKRPRYLQLRRDHPNSSWWIIVIQCFCGRRDQTPGMRTSQDYISNVHDDDCDEGTHHDDHYDKDINDGDHFHDDDHYDNDENEEEEDEDDEESSPQSNKQTMDQFMDEVQEE